MTSRLFSCYCNGRGYNLFNVVVALPLHSLVVVRIFDPVAVAYLWNGLWKQRPQFSTWV